MPFAGSRTSRTDESFLPARIFARFFTTWELLVLRSERPEARQMFWLPCEPGRADLLVGPDARQRVPTKFMAGMDEDGIVEAHHSPRSCRYLLILPSAKPCD